MAAVKDEREKGSIDALFRADDSAWIGYSAVGADRGMALIITG